MNGFRTGRVSWLFLKGEEGLCNQADSDAVGTNYALELSVEVNKPSTLVGFPARASVSMTFIFRGVLLCFAE